jgi:integrase
MATIRKRKWTTPTGEPREAWVVRYADQNGKWRLKTFARQREAKEWRATMLQEVRHRTHLPDSTAPTVASAAEAWIRRGEADKLERSTIKQRRQHVDLHILPLLGRDTKLSRIEAGKFRDELLRTRSRPLAKKVMTSLKAILRQAGAAHLAADVARIETGGRHKRRLEVGRDIPTQDEVRALLAGASGYMRPLLAAAVFCGLRMSEIRALRWSDVDLEARQLHVRQRADKWCQIGPLKSGTSYRSVPLSPLVVIFCITNAFITPVGIHSPYRCTRNRVTRHFTPRTKARPIQFRSSRTARVNSLLPGDESLPSRRARTDGSG